MTFEPSQALTRQLPRMGELLPRRQTFRLLHKARPSGKLAAPQAMPERVFLMLRSASPAPASRCPYTLPSSVQSAYRWQGHRGSAAGGRRSGSPLRSCGGRSFKPAVPDDPGTPAQGLQCPAPAPAHPARQRLPARKLPVPSARPTRAAP